MKIEELANYGKGFVEIMTAPEFVKRGSKVMMREFRRELGLIGLLKMGWRTRKEAKRIKKPRLVEAQRAWIHRPVIFRLAYRKHGGNEGAGRHAVYRRVWDRTAYDLMTSLYPPLLPAVALACQSSGGATSRLA